MKDSLELNIKGIKCDECNYKNENVKFEDYEKWLNRPCPKCGSNLLTKEDLESIRLLIAITETFNRVLPKSNNEDKKVAMSVEMNGTGEISFSLKDNELN